MSIIAKKFKELWQIGGPIAVGMAVGAILLVEEGVRFLLSSETASMIAMGEVSNIQPFFLQSYGTIILGIIVLVIFLYYYYRMRLLEQEKDRYAISALEASTKTITSLLDKIDDQPRAAIIEIVETNLIQANKLMEKLISKIYVY